MTRSKHDTGTWSPTAQRATAILAEVDSTGSRQPAAVFKEIAKREGILVPQLRYWLKQQGRMAGTLINRVAEQQAASRGESTGVNLLEIEAWLRKTLKRQSSSLAELAGMSGASQGEIIDLLHLMESTGDNIQQIHGRYRIDKNPQPTDFGLDHAYVSRPDNTYVFGFTGDQHLCSKYAREDVLNDLYDKFADAGVDRVFNTGNWIDGEKLGINLYDLHTIGLGNQMEYLAAAYPKREGIHTFSVWGDDHEGWYAQKTGIDMGRQAESYMQEAGRDDWHNLGFMDAFVPLQNANSENECKLMVMHPGGGSSYAVSYRPQKIIESLEGGEKPAVLLIGHYHKISYNIFRNVHAIQTGCCQDQTTFMRKKTIEPHIGGGILTVRQDPVTGAIIECAPHFFTYFNKRFYTNNRWNYEGEVTSVPRVFPATPEVTEKPVSTNSKAPAGSSKKRSKAVQPKPRSKRRSKSVRRRAA